jgi:hypothetical protein
VVLQEPGQRPAVTSILTTTLYRRSSKGFFDHSERQRIANKEMVKFALWATTVDDSRSTRRVSDTWNDWSGFICLSFITQQLTHADSDITAIYPHSSYFKLEGLKQALLPSSVAQSLSFKREKVTFVRMSTKSLISKNFIAIAF